MKDNTALLKYILIVSGAGDEYEGVAALPGSGPALLLFKKVTDIQGAAFGGLWPAILYPEQSHRPLPENWCRVF